MRIVVDNQAQIRAFGGDELRDWRDNLKRVIPGAKYTPQFKAGHWDGTFRPGKWLGWTGNECSVQLGRGMLARLMRDFSVESISFAAGVPAVLTPLDLSDLPENFFDHQRDSIEIASRVPWGRFALATNAGKGAVIAMLARASAQAGEPCIILSDEIAVVDALVGELAKWIGRKPALIQSGMKEPPDDLVTVAMIPTLYKRITETRGETFTQAALKWQRWLAGMRMALFDEADKATAKTWQTVAMGLDGTTRRYGFSGTFPKYDSLEDLQLEEILGPALQVVKNAELVEKEISAKPTVVLHAFKSGLQKPHWEEWRDMTPQQRRSYVYEYAVLKNKRRHALIKQLLREDAVNAIIVNRIEHGEDLEETIEGSVFVDGSVSPARRVQILEEFEQGKFHTLIVTKILDRGSNRLGKVENFIFASAEGSNRQTLQRVGRGLRRTDGKATLVLHDIIDSGYHYLENLARRRIELYGEEGFEVQIGRRAS